MNWIKTVIVHLFCSGVDIGDFIKPLNIPSHKLVFFAVNDNESTNSVGGSHWYVFILIFDFYYLQERGIWG